MTDKPTIHVPTRDDRMRADYEGRLHELDDGPPVPLVQPTADEARNGWTAEKLTAYLASVNISASMRIDPKSAMRRSPPQRANGKYNPHYWRRPRS